MRTKKAKRPLIRLLRDVDPEGILEVLVFSADEELLALSLEELEALVAAGQKYLAARRP